MLVLDLGAFHRNAHEVSLREALSWSVVRITLVLSFVGIKMTIVDLYKIPIETSLAVIAGILTVAMVASLLVKPRVTGAPAVRDLKSGAP
jgi:tellurite resistance protein TerC